MTNELKKKIKKKSWPRDFCFTYIAINIKLFQMQQLGPRLADYIYSIIYFPHVMCLEPQGLCNFLLILPMMVSLRGRCLEVMTCREGAMDWIRMIGWLGS